MSLISRQIDELRVMAQLEKNLERPLLARILSNAADTIDEQRDLLAEMCTLADYLCNAVTDDRDWDCDQCCPLHEGNRKKRCKLGELQVRLQELGIEVRA